jgi:ParB/RepB/Spo0J family partition protein
MDDHSHSPSPANGQGELETDDARSLGMRLVSVPIARIVTNGNPRGVASMDGIRRLATSIAGVGLIEPLAVAERGDGDFDLVAGERRLEALRLLGRSEAPCVVDDDDDPLTRRARSAAENMARVALDPATEGQEIARLMRDTALSLEEACEVLGVSPQTGRSRLELLALPQPVREHLRAGRLTLSNGATLVKVAEASRDLASEIAERVASGALPKKALDDDPGTVLAEIATEGDLSGPFCLPFSEGTRLQIGEVARQLKARPLYRGLVREDEEAEAAHNAEHKGKPSPPKRPRSRRQVLDGLASAGPSELVEVSAEAVMRARAWGGLVEYRRDRFTTTSFLTCPAFCLDWLFEAEKERLSIGEVEAESKKSPDEKELAAEKEALRRAAAEAKASNEIIGHRTKTTLDFQGDVSLEQATVIASLLLDAYGKEILAGLALVKFDWNYREVKEMRGGGVRTIERPAQPDEAREKFEEHLARAKTGPELLGRLFTGIVAAVGADQRSLAASQRRVLELPFAPGRTDTVIGRAPAALLAECEPILTEKRFGEVREELGVELAGELRDRRSPRQRAREEAERAERERARESSEAHTSHSGSLLDELDERAAIEEREPAEDVELGVEAGEGPADAREEMPATEGGAE